MNQTMNWTKPSQFANVTISWSHNLHWKGLQSLSVGFDENLASSWAVREQHAPHRSVVLVILKGLRKTAWKTAEQWELSTETEKAGEWVESDDMLCSCFSGCLLILKCIVFYDIIFYYVSIFVCKICPSALGEQVVELETDYRSTYKNE